MRKREREKERERGGRGRKKPEGRVMFSIHLISGQPWPFIIAGQLSVVSVPNTLSYLQPRAAWRRWCRY